MKATLSIVVAFVFMLIGWFILTAILVLIGNVASKAREGMGVIYFLHFLIMLVLGPGYGGYLATFITPKIFKTIDLQTIYTGFISVVITLGIIIGVVSLLFMQKEGEINASELIKHIVQISAIIVGAKIGKLHI